VRSGHRLFILKRGYQKLVEGSRVLVVDDIVNTGASMRGIAQAVDDHGGDVVAAAAVCQRGTAGAEDLGVGDWP
jgi:orotate phosphoribosyltransferase